MGLVLRLSVRAELARRVDVVTEDAVFEQRDLAGNVRLAIVERDGDHVLVCGGRLHAGERRSVCRSRSGSKRQRRSGDDRTALHPAMAKQRILTHLSSSLIRLLDVVGSQPTLE